jgi:hypothetical protein
MARTAELSMIISAAPLVGEQVSVIQGVRGPAHMSGTAPTDGQEAAGYASPVLSAFDTGQALTERLLQRLSNVIVAVTSKA